MFETQSTPEAATRFKPELVKYDEGFVLEVSNPGSEVSFDGHVKTRDGEAFDVTQTVGTVVALDTVDFDGNRSIFVAGTAFDDLVCRIDVVDGETRYVIQSNPDFNGMLASRPMTVGARHDRLNQRKLRKASALPQTGIVDGSESKAAPEGVSSPVMLGSRLMLDFVASEKNQ